MKHLSLEDDQRIAVAGTDILAIHTPGHSPGGSTCLYLPEAGGNCSAATPCSPVDPAQRGRSYSDFPTIIESIRDKLFALPPAETKVHTGHGDGTTIGTEAPHLEEWIRAGS